MITVRSVTEKAAKSALYLTKYSTTRDRVSPSKKRQFHSAGGFCTETVHFHKRRSSGRAAPSESTARPTELVIDQNLDVLLTSSHSVTKRQKPV